MNIKKHLKKLKGFFKDIDIINKNKAVELIEFEVMELENIFCLTLFGSFIGMPSPPIYIALKLLPIMEEDLKLVFNRINVANDALAELVSILGEP